MSHDMTKPIMWLYTHRRLRSARASAQSHQSSLSVWRKLGSLATHWLHNGDSDQTGRMPRLIWVFDQTRWMPRLIWVFAGCTVILLVLSWDGSNKYSAGVSLMEITRSFITRFFCEGLLLEIADNDTKLTVQIQKKKCQCKYSMLLYKLLTWISRRSSVIRI